VKWFILGVVCFIIFFKVMISRSMHNAVVRMAYNTIRKRRPEISEDELLFETLKTRNPFRKLSDEAIHWVLHPTASDAGIELDSIHKGRTVRRLIERRRAGEAEFKPIKNIDELSQFIVDYEKTNLEN